MLCLNIVVKNILSFTQFWRFYKKKTACVVNKSSYRVTISNYSGTPPYDHPVITTTPLIRPPRYYDHFFVARTKAHSFSYLKTPLIQPPRYYNQRPLFGVLSRHFLYKFTLFIRPVKMLGENRHNLTKNKALIFY